MGTGVGSSPDAGLPFICLSLQTLCTPVQVLPQPLFGLPLLYHSVEVLIGEGGKLVVPAEEPGYEVEDGFSGDLN